MSDDMRLGISIEVDKQKIDAAKKQMGSVKDTTRSIETALKDVERAGNIDNLTKKFAAQAAETGKTRRAAIELANELRKVGATDKEIEKVANAFGKMTVKAQEAQRAAASASRATPTGGGALGKVGGALTGGVGALGGLAGAAGIDSGVVDVVNQLGESMKTASESGKGLSGILSSSAAKMGLVGAAIGALTIALGKLQEAVKKANEPLDAYYNSQDKLRELYVKGASQLDVEKRVAELKRAQEFEQAAIEKTARLREKAFADLSASFGDVLARAAVQAGYGKTNDEQLEASQKRLQEINQELNALQGGLEKNMFAPVEASGKQAAAEVAKALDRTGDEAKGAADKTKDLNDALKQQQQAADQARQAQENYNKSVAQAGVDLRRANEDAKRRLGDANRDTQQKFAQDLEAITRKRFDGERDAMLKNMQDGEKAQRDYARTLRDINKDTLRQQEDALENRDFLAFRRIQKDNARRIEDAQQAFDDQAQERQIQQAIEAQDRMRAFEQERRERAIANRQQLQDNRKAYQDQLRENALANQRKLEDLRRELELTRNTQQQKLSILQQAAQAELQIAGQLAGAIRGLAGAPAQRPQQAVNNNNINMTFNAANPNSMAQTANMLRQVGIVG